MDNQNFDNVFENESNNNYKGNGWNKYQLLVMNQLKSHLTAIEKNAENHLKVKEDLQEMRIEDKLWKKTADENFDKIKHALDAENEKSITHRLKKIEESAKVEDMSKMKIKAFWGLIGGFIIIAIDVIVKAITLYLNSIKG